LTYSVTVDIREALQRFDVLQRSLRDFRPAFVVIDKHVTTVFARQFASLGAFGGTLWAALRPSTIRARASVGRGRGGILRDTNRLWASLVKGRGPESVRVIGKDDYRRGTAVPYAQYHQSGTASMPQRQVIPDPMPRAVTQVWAKILARYIETGSPLKGRR